MAVAESKTGNTDLQILSLTAPLRGGKDQLKLVTSPKLCTLNVLTSHSCISRHADGILH